MNRDTITNKSYRAYDKLSRYSAFPFYFNIQDNKYFYGITNQLDDTTAYMIHIASKEDTIDSIALKYYNTPNDFWILCDFNRIRDPFIKLKEGQQIKVPVITSIRYKD